MDYFNSMFLAAQNQRSANDSAARDRLIEKQTKDYYLGEADGVFGLKPTSLEDSYWAGYCVGLKRYHITQSPSLAAQLPTEF